MSTIPANYDVDVIPGVLSAGGAALELIGLALTTNTRVPIGAPLSFPSALTVSNYFGASAQESIGAGVYFLGFNNATARPAALLFAQYNQNDVAAYVRGANPFLTVAQLKLLNQALNITMDGYAYSGTANLSSATSYSSAAGIIQTALNGSLPAGSSFTGSVAASTFSVTGTVAGALMTVSAVSSGTIETGAVISGTGITSGTQVGTQISGTPGGIGVYALSKYQAAPTVSATISGTYGTLTVTGSPTGTISVGQFLTGAASGTQITALGTGTGGAGTYFLNLTQTIGSGPQTTTAPPLSVTYDSVSAAFVITSGSQGAGSTVAFPTGALATSLCLTQALGAVLSQGAAAQTPATFMNNLIQQTTNWASLFTVFEPDGSIVGNYGGNTVKAEFAAWVNTTQDEFAYVCWDMDITPTLSNFASTSLGQQLIASNSSGTILVYQPSDLLAEWFVAGAAASINFTATNGRITFKFKSQTGLIAGVTNENVAANLKANGYNCYSVSATAAQQFQFFREGTISGPFEWADAYYDQIWLDSALQQALMVLLTTVNSVPYTNAGYALIEAACLDPINAALLFGAIRPGVPLSQQQIAEITFASGNASAASLITSQGYYLQVNPASAQTRQNRLSPPCTLWYADGGSVHTITLASIDVQ